MKLIVTRYKCDGMMDLVLSGTDTVENRDVAKIYFDPDNEELVITAVQEEIEEEVFFALPEWEN